MERLGLIGAYDHKRTSGFYGPQANKALQDAKPRLGLYGYDNVFNALASSGAEQGFDVSRDGTRLYVAVQGTRLTATIFQYNLSTPWDLSTISYANKSLVVGDYDTLVSYVSISDDGTRLYFAGWSCDTVWSATLSTPYDLATAVMDVKKFYLGTQDATPCSTKFSSDGTAMYMLGATNKRFYQYSLSSAWDVSTASYVNQSPSVTTQEATPLGMFVGMFGPYQLFYWVIGSTSKIGRAYYTFVPNDVSFALYNSGFDATTTAVPDTVPRDIYAYNLSSGSSSQISYFVLGQTNKKIMQIIGGSVVNTSIALGENTPTGMWFKPDGTKLYITGTTNDAVRQFSLSTAWDLSTVTFEKSLSIGFETAPTGVTLSDDGTKLYITGITNDCVYQIPLRTAWDIGTASGFTYVGATEANPRSIQIANNGTLLYIAGDASAAIRKYTLSVPYDLGTATLSQSFTISGVLGIDVSEDGRLIFATTISSSALTPGGGRQIRSISMTTPHDLTTATLSTTDWIPIYGLTGANTSPWAVRVSRDRTRMFLISDVVSGIYQFSLRFA